MSIGVSGLMFAHISSIIAAASSLSGPKFRSDSVFSSYFKLPAPTKTPSPYLVPLGKSAGTSYYGDRVKQDYTVIELRSLLACSPSTCDGVCRSLIVHWYRILQPTAYVLSEAVNYLKFTRAVHTKQTGCFR
jgi:hypothetical protein